MCIIHNWECVQKDAVRIWTDKKGNKLWQFYDKVVCRKCGKVNRFAYRGPSSKEDGMGSIFADVSNNKMNSAVDKAIEYAAQDEPVTTRKAQSQRGCLFHSYHYVGPELQECLRCGKYRWRRPDGSTAPYNPDGYVNGFPTKPRGQIILKEVLEEQGLEGDFENYPGGRMAGFYINSKGRRIGEMNAKEATLWVESQFKDSAMTIVTEMERHIGIGPKVQIRN